MRTYKRHRFSPQFISYAVWVYMLVVTENLNNLARNIDLLGGLGSNQALLGLITFIGLFLQLVHLP